MLTEMIHNLGKPMLLFFYMGFIASIGKVRFRLPDQVEKGLTIFVLIAIGWHGGEELAELPASTFQQAAGFMFIGFLTNLFIGFAAYSLLRWWTKLHPIDAATIAGYYGSDSAGTFVTCLGVLAAANIAYAAYMPAMLAVMEIPGCIVALILVGRLRQKGVTKTLHDEGEFEVVSGNKISFKQHLIHLLREEGIFLLISGMVIGYLSRLQGTKVTAIDDKLFVEMFHGLLCLFLLKTGLHAGEQVEHLRHAGFGLIMFGICGPVMFATIGICVVHGYSWWLHQPFDLGTYALFSVLCAAASYIAMVAVQSSAIPEASKTLPLAASLGLTFSFNVTVGIALYMEIARLVIRTFPII